MAYLDPNSVFAFPIFDGKTYLTEVEHKQVDVLFDQLFPHSKANGVPGARHAKAADFLSQLLALDEREYYKIPDWRQAYRDGLPLLDSAAQHRFQKKLEDLSGEQAHEFLTELGDGKLEGLPKSFSQRTFFKMLLEHCIKGCFADPRWGGNHQSVMWRWLGWVQPAEDIRF